MEETAGICSMSNFYDPCDGEVEYGPDPYTYDIHGEIIMVWLCDRHYETSCMDI